VNQVEAQTGILTADQGGLLIDLATEIINELSVL
jgi:hypothetical protein